MKKILKRINEEAIQTTEKKETLKQMYEKLMQEQKDINEQVKKANQIKGKDDDLYEKMYSEIREKSKKRKESFDKYKKKKQEVENKILRSKKAILKDLNYKHRIVKDYINKNLKDIDIKSLKKEEAKLRNEVKLIRVTSEEFKKLNSEQQKTVIQAQSDYNKNKQRLSEIRGIISFIKIVGDKNPEEILQQIDYAIEQVNNNFDLENIDKLVSFNIDDKNIAQEDKEKKGKNDNKKQEDEKNETLDENTKGKIEINKKDILKYMKMIEKYKDNPQKCNDFIRAIKDLKDENKKLYEKLKINDPKEEEKIKKEQHGKREDINKEQHDKEQKVNEGQQDKEENDKKRYYENIFNKIDSNTKDILKYMKLLHKYKDDKAKCNDFIRAIDDLEKERKKLYEMLNPTKQKSEDIEQSNLKKTVSPKESFELQKKNFTQNEQEKNSGIEKKKGLEIEQKDILRIEQKEISEIEQKDNRRPAVMFDRKTGNYIYIDENGKSTEYSHFFYQMTGEDGNKSGRYHEMIEKDEKKHMMEIAMSKGLTKKQAKMIDFNIYRILQGKNTQLLDKYIESLKGNEEFDKGFDILYDLRKKDKDIKRNIGIRNIRNISKKAKKHEKLGIAKVYRDKSRALLYSVLGALGLATVGGGTTMFLNSSNNEKVEAKSVLEGTLANEINKIKDDSNVTNKDDGLYKEENALGDFVKISKGAMLFNDPTDELRIMRGVNANEKVTIKSNSQDRIYKVTKTGYYSPTGECIEVEAGESLEEALQKKGLDKTFIEDENTIKMCHTVAEGVAQWVNVKDVENVEVKTDKFGNTLDKTEEEREVEEAYENYMKQHSKTNGAEQSQR